MASASTNTAGPLKRLIVIDGANFMHGVKEVYPVFNSCNDDRPNALPLALFMLDLIKKGYRVRVCVLPFYNEKTTRNFYALEMLIANSLAIESIKRGKETDDLCVLEIGRNYGAAIISNDRFNNHRSHYDVTRIMRFEPLSTNWEPKDFADPSKFRSPFAACKVKLTEADVAVAPGSEDYAKVKQSYSKFREPSIFSLENIDAFRDYIHDLYYFRFYMELPSRGCVGGHFIRPNDFPHNYHEYTKLWRRACL